MLQCENHVKQINLKFPAFYFEFECQLSHKGCQYEIVNNRKFLQLKSVLPTQTGLFDHAVHICIIFTSTRYYREQKK
jgi:hypothetical protein